VKVEVAVQGSSVPGSLYGLWGRKATLNYTELNLIVVARGYRQATGSPAVVEGEESETLSAFVVTDSLLINSSVGDRLVGPVLPGYLFDSEEFPSSSVIVISFLL